MTVVKTIFHESKGSAGARTIADIATNRGFALSRYRAGNLKWPRVILKAVSSLSMRIGKQNKNTLRSQTGYHFFAQAKHEIIDYIIGYYSQVRPHQHNDGLAPNVAEEKYWIEYKTVAKKT